MTALDQPTADLPRPFGLRLQPDRDTIYIELKGELDLASVPSVREQVQELLEAGFEHLAIDLRALSFMDITGLRLLLGLAHTAQCDGWRLSLIQGRPAVRRIFALTDTLDKLPFVSPSALAGR